MTQPKWIVTKVTPHENYTLTLTFITGETKTFDMQPYIRQKPWSPLKNQALFMQPFLSCGSVAWNDDIDIAPETLYEESI